MLKIWTDGSCLGNPGPGGWGFIATDGKNIAELAAMHGIDIPVSCGAGVCGVCLCKVEE